MLSNQSILILLSWKWYTGTCCGKWNQIRWLYSKFLKCVLLWAAVWYDARDYLLSNISLGYSANMIQCQWLNQLVFISVSPCTIYIEIWIKDLKEKKNVFFLAKACFLKILLAHLTTQSIYFLAHPLRKAPNDCFDFFLIDPKSKWYCLCLCHECVRWSVTWRAIIE